MIGEMDKQLGKLNKPPLGPHYMDKKPAAAKLKLHTCEMDKPGLLGEVVFCVFCRPPLRWRPQLRT